MTFIDKFKSIDTPKKETSKKETSKKEISKKNIVVSTMLDLDNNISLYTLTKTKLLKTLFELIGEILEVTIITFEKDKVIIKQRSADNIQIEMVLNNLNNDFTYYCKEPINIQIELSVLNDILKTIDDNYSTRILYSLSNKDILKLIFEDIENKIIKNFELSLLSDEEVQQNFINFDYNNMPYYEIEIDSTLFQKQLKNFNTICKKCGNPIIIELICNGNSFLLQYSPDLNTPTSNKNSNISILEGPKMKITSNNNINNKTVIKVILLTDLLKIIKCNNINDNVKIFMYDTIKTNVNEIRTQLIILYNIDKIGVMKYYFKTAFKKLQ